MRLGRILLAPTLLVAACTHEADPELRLLGSAIYDGTRDTEHHAVGGIVGKYASGCTATLVGRRTVLTAAHCVCRESPYDTPELPLTFTDSRGTNFEAEAAVVTPMTSGGFWERDLALVRLERQVPGIVPALLTSVAPTVGETITVVGRGWGGLSELPGVTRMGTNVIAHVGSQHIEFSNTFGAATCSGDSGGPSYATRSGEERLISVHSAGSAGQCGVPYGTALDTRVDVYLPWVTQQAQGDLYAGAPIDTEPPRVSILSPTDGEEVPRDITVKVEVTDNVAVVAVKLKLDGTTQEELTRAPFEFPLAQLSSGSHTLEVEARDAEENVGTAIASVSLQPGAGFGEACTEDEDCASRLCRDGLCTIGCSSLKPCPEGLTCESLACVPSDGGGCSLSGRQPASWWVLLLLLIGVRLGARRSDISSRRQR